MERPELKQFGDLTQADFDRHPVWIGSHTADYDEPWYEETDEETFRPWTGGLPADPAAGMLLVTASYELPDGSRYPGFLTPDRDPADLGTLQPHLFAGNRAFGFWGGLFGVPGEERQAFYTTLGKGPADIFPVRFRVEAALVADGIDGRVDGFYRLAGAGQLQVEP